jgi:DNA-binding XRE family transcriptional regulator
MKPRKTFQSLYQKLPATKRTQIEKRVNETLAEMELKELRAHRHLSQTVVGEALGIKQAAVSRIEGRDDLMLSTLQSYIEALGGSLELIAHFPEGDVKINHS